MNKRIVNKAMIECLRPKSRIFGCHNAHTNKAIDMITEVITKRIWFMVSTHHTAVYHGPDLDEAIGIYNKL
jgi:hypothetical protein